MKAKFFIDYESLDGSLIESPSPFCPHPHGQQVQESHHQVQQTQREAACKYDCRVCSQPTQRFAPECAPLALRAQLSGEQWKAGALLDPVVLIIIFTEDTLPLP